MVGQTNPDQSIVSVPLISPRLTACAELATEQERMTRVAAELEHAQKTRAEEHAEHKDRLAQMAQEHRAATILLRKDLQLATENAVHDLRTQLAVCKSLTFQAMHRHVCATLFAMHWGAS